MPYLGCSHLRSIHSLPLIRHLLWVKTLSGGGGTQVLNQAVLCLRKDTHRNSS